MGAAPIEADSVEARPQGVEVFVRLLGTPEVLVDGRSHPMRSERSHELLAYLACAGTWISRERLADLFWPDRGGSAARSNLRNVLFTTRDLPFCAGLQIDPHGARWQVTTDLAQLRHAVAEHRWDAALTLCRGPLLDGIDPAAGMRDWLDAERAGAFALWRDAVLGALEEETEGAIDGARRLLSADPFDEAVLLALARLLRDRERRDEAIAACRAYATRVRGDLGVEPSTPVRDLIDELDRDRAPPAASADITRFFGRTRELQEIDELLAQSDCRLLTLVGSGGSGKTRLARRAAERARCRWHWVALESIGHADGVASAVADAIGVTLHDAAGVTDALSTALSDGPRLLVLDNLEHVLDALPLVTKLLERCPRLRVLATSRVRLGLEGEWLLPVEGFACAPRADVHGEAECFFAQCARRATADFELTAANRAEVHEIATLLAGNPLALELAAGWVRVLPLAEIAAELRNDIGLLGAGADAYVPRHGSLRASFEHSWRLLSDRERDALARLAVFRGGFTRDAARQVADVPLPVLAALLDKSLLRYDGHRYDRHPLIHQFTQLKLAGDTALAERMRGRHAEFFARLLQDVAARPAPRRQRLARLRPEWENIVLATDWLAAHGRWDTLADCSNAIARDPSAFGNLDVGAAWGGRMLAALARSSLDPPLALVARLQSDRLWLQIFLELPRDAERLAQAALQAARAAGNIAAEVQALRSLGHLARRAARNRAAHEHFEHALRLARDSDLLREEAMLLDALAMVQNRTGDYESAAANARAALAINERIGADEQRMYNYFNLGESRSLSGRPAEGLPWLTQCVALAREIDFEQFLTYGLVGLAQCRLALGDLADALRHAQQAESEAQRLDDSTAAGLASLVLARAQLQAGELNAAQRRLQSTLAVALQRDDGLVQVAAIPVAARLQLARRREREAASWLRWIALRPDLSHDAAQEAARLLGPQTIPEATQRDADTAIELTRLAREIEVSLASDTAITH